MLSKDMIECYKLANSILKNATSQIKTLRPSKVNFTTTLVEVIARLSIVNIHAAQALAKEIGVKLIKDNNIRITIPSLTEEDLVAYNFFIVRHDTTSGSYLKVIWGGN